jgi:hypothetical protein
MQLCLDLREPESVRRYVLHAPPFTCARCNEQSVVPAHNIGQWRCVYHPGALDRASGCFSCCQRTDPSGCTRCDHVASAAECAYPVALRAADLRAYAIRTPTAAATIANVRDNPCIVVRRTAQGIQ